MNKEKQTEEMAKAMHDGCAIVRGTNQCRGEDCLNCGAVTLYEKGYRKASEVAEEIFAEIEKIANQKFSIQHGVVLMSKEGFAELKKKYTEENHNDSRTN